MASHSDAATARREVWKITVYLTVLTIIELALGFIMYKMDWQDGTFIKMFTKIVIILLMLWKAFYIIAYFMHLKYETLSMIKITAIPCLLFIWFIIAFLWDGNSFKNLRARYTPYHVEHFKQPMKSVQHHGEDVEVPAQNVKDPQTDATQH